MKEGNPSSGKFATCQRRILLKAVTALSFKPSLAICKLARTGGCKTSSPPKKKAQLSPGPTLIYMDKKNNLNFSYTATSSTVIRLIFPFTTRYCSSTKS